MTVIRRRSLVLIHEGARHAFRRSLPAHVFATRSEQECDQEDAAAARRWRMTGRDWRHFLGTYSASVIAMLVFLA